MANTKKKATLKKIKAQKLFVYKHAAIEVETEVTQEILDVMAQITEDMQNAMGHFLQRAGVRNENELTPAKRKKYDELIEEQARGMVRDEVVQLLTDYDPDELRAHFAECYGDLLGVQKYANWQTTLVTKAFEFINTP